MSNTTQRKATISLAAVMKLGGMAGALLVLGTIAGCSASYDGDANTTESQSVAPEASDVLLTMRGNEPFWTAQMGTSELRFDLMGKPSRRYALHSVSVAQETWRTYHLKSADNHQKTAALTVYNTLCYDSMSGMPYPQQVVFNTEQNQLLHGCAGDPSELLVGSEWLIIELNDKALESGITATIEFSDSGAVYGSSGCNRYTGTYNLTGENLQFSRLASTRMACEPNRMDFEDQLLNAFSKVNGFAFNEAGHLHLMLNDGSVIRARR